MKETIPLRKGCECNADTVVGPINEVHATAVKTTPMADHFGLVLFIVAFTGICTVKHPTYTERYFSQIFTISFPLVRFESLELPPRGALNGYQLLLLPVVLDANGLARQGCIASLHYCAASRVLQQ